MTGWLLGVSAPLKDLIERPEPGTHQFWPMTLTMPRGATFPGPYFGMVAHQYLDSFLPDDSDPEALDLGLSAPFIRRSHDKRAQGIALSNAVIGDAHLWREKTPMGLDIYLSDTLHSAIKRQKLKTLLPTIIDRDSSSHHPTPPPNPLASWDNQGVGW